MLALTQSIDKFFNVLGYIPIVSTVSGGIRVGVYSALQGLAALVCLMVTLLIALILFLAKQGERQRTYLAYARASAFHILDGRLNAGRGIVELFPIIGNLLCYGYDKMVKGTPLLAAPK